MAFTVQQKRSNTLGKRPAPQELVFGQLGVNYNAETPGVFLKTDLNTISKVGGATVSNTEPTLAETGYTTYSRGEFWVDTSDITNIQLKVFDGSDWINAAPSTGGGSLQTGTVTPLVSCTYDLGSPSFKWRNLYVCDMNMSNEGMTNDVDGTWGAYTLQEGEDDLFIINRRSGKKYKFVLEEVA